MRMVQASQISTVSKDSNLAETTSRDLRRDKWLDQYCIACVQEMGRNMSMDNCHLLIGDRQALQALRLSML
jgi:hypothetical protein